MFDRVSPKGFLFDVRILQDTRRSFHHSQQQIVQVVLCVLDSLLLQLHHALHVDYQLDKLLKYGIKLASWDCFYLRRSHLSRLVLEFCHHFLRDPFRDISWIRLVTLPSDDDSLIGDAGID
jgi:hypothetical protein